jgi:hypothetical protein
MTTGKDVPTGYQEIVNVLNALPLIVREKRRRDRLSLRAAEADSGVSAGTINRCEQGDGLQMSHAVALLSWVGGFR